MRSTPPTKAGRVLTYDFTVTNTGNVTLTDAAVTGTADPPVGPFATAPSCQSFVITDGDLLGATTALVVRRGFDLVECGSSSADFGHDLLGGLVPYEGAGVVVPVFGPGLDGVDECGNTREAAAA